MVYFVSDELELYSIVMMTILEKGLAGKLELRTEYNYKTGRIIPNIQPKDSFRESFTATMMLRLTQTLS